MTRGFPWFAVHKDTRFVIAGFIDFNDAEAFCAIFSHGLYVVRSGTDMA